MQDLAEYDIVMLAGPKQVTLERKRRCRQVQQTEGITVTYAVMPTEL